MVVSGSVQMYSGSRDNMIHWYFVGEVMRRGVTTNGVGCGGKNFEGTIQSSILDTVNLSIRQLRGGSPAMTRIVIFYSSHVVPTTK